MTRIPKSTIYAAIIVSCSFVTAVGIVKADESDEKLWKKLDITQDGWLDGTELKGGWSAFAIVTGSLSISTSRRSDRKAPSWVKSL